MKKTTQLFVFVLTLAVSTSMAFAQMPTPGTQYWLKNYRDGGKFMNTSNAGTDFDKSNLSALGKYEVEMNGSTYAIKRADNGEYLQKPADNMSNPLNFGTTSYSGWNIVEATTAGDGGNTVAGLSGLRINASDVDAAAYMHMKVAGAGYGLRTYNAVEDANIWVFTNAKIMLQEVIDKAEARYNATEEGTDAGQFSADARTAFQTAINNAKAISGSDDFDVAYLDGIEPLETAITEYNNNELICLPEGGTTADHTTRTITSGEIVIGTTKVTMPAYENWLEADAANIIKVKRAETITITVAAETQQAEWAEIYAFIDWNRDGLWAQDATERYFIAKGSETPGGHGIGSTSFNITVPADAEVGRTVLRIKSDEAAVHGKTDPSNPCANIYSGSVYNYYLQVDYGTGVEESKSPAYGVSVVDGMITVDGADSFAVYALTGQKVNAANKLDKGVYIVKVNDYTQKVIVK